MLISSHPDHRITTESNRDGLRGFRAALRLFFQYTICTGTQGRSPSLPTEPH
jgi:hypothetical protein